MQKTSGVIQMRSNAGVANLLLVLLMSLVAIVVVAVVQSRLLLAIQRNRSLSDILIASYDSESTVNDILRTILGYSATFPPDGVWPPLADGTVIEVKTEDIDPNTKKLSLIARRPFAVSKIEAVKNTTAVVSQYDNFEVALSLDCTASMVEVSDQSNPLLPRSEWKSRMRAEKEAVLYLINYIEDHVPNKDKLKLGINVFRDNTRWLQATIDTANVVRSDQVFDKTRLINAIEYAYPNGPDCDPYNPLTYKATLDCWEKLYLNTTLCNGIDCYIDVDKTKFDKFPACGNPIGKPERLNGNTSISSGLIFSEDNLTKPRLPTTKQAIVLVTDGSPNVAIKDLRDAVINPYGCDNQYYCANRLSFCKLAVRPISGYNTGPVSVGDCQNIGGTYIYGDPCKQPAKDQVACSMADHSQNVSQNGNAPGRRDPDVDLYMLTVYSGVAQELKNLYTDYIDSNYIELNNAGELSAKLSEIFKIITTSSSTITIRRVTP